MASCDHFTSIHFFKIILKSTLQSGKLRISNKFTRIYGGGFPNPVFLKPPDGTEWDVYWIKHDDEIWFQKGWQEFAIYYSLDHGHLVMFKYEGTSNLGIVILDKSGLEIDYALHSPHDNVSDDSVEILDEIPPQQKARPKPLLSSLQAHKKMRIEERSNLQNLNLHYHSQGNESPSTEVHHPILANININRNELKEDVGVNTFTTDCIRKVESSTANKMMEALKRASTFRSENPFCIIVMQPSHVSERFSLRMPTQFTEKYLPENHAAVQLQALDGRAWSAMYKAPTIHVGWKKFAVDNNLKVGDVCVFELTQGIDLSFKVLIFRFAEDVSCSLWQAYGSKAEKIKPESVLHNNPACFYPMDGVKELSRQKHDYFGEKWGRGISTSNKRLKFKVPTHKQSSPKNRALGKAIETQIVCKAQEDGVNCIEPRRIPDSGTKYVSTSKAQEAAASCIESERVVDMETKTLCMSRDVKATQRTSSYIRPGRGKALEEAKRFSSENPFFTVNIRPCYLVKSSPNVSCDFLRRYNKNMKQKVMIQYGKRSWMVKLLYYPDLPLGKFSAGWPLFVKENKLEAGDACVFELINAEEFVLGVHIFRCQR